MSNPIPVTKPFFPPIEEYQLQLARVWASGWLANRGDLAKELEIKVKEKLASKNLPLAMTNGTLPLQIALKLLGKGGEIITTPFSYVATTSSIVWEGCVPVFADIDPVYWTMDPAGIEKAISPRTTCILATHVFGNPCDVEEISRIAAKHNLHVIYDAAHCFGVSYKGTSIFDWGDISTCSFHATKLFHTAEGGAAFVNKQDLYNEVFYSHNFGHDGPVRFQGLGINGKISELQAAMGLAVLPHVDAILQRRKEHFNYYESELSKLSLQGIAIRERTEWNYSYVPALFEDEIQLNRVISALEKEHIFPRRYFYPSLNSLPYLKTQPCPISEEIAGRILILPSYYELSKEDRERIIFIIGQSL